MYITICEIDCQSKFDAWNRALKASVLEQPRGMGWEGRWEGRGSGWGTHVHPWLIHVNVWQKPPQYYKVISLQLKLINLKKAKTLTQFKTSPHLQLRPSLVFPFGGRGMYNWFHVYFLLPLILPLAAVVRGLVEGRERVKDQEWGTVLPGAVAWYRTIWVFRSTIVGSLWGTFEDSLGSTIAELSHFSKWEQNFSPLSRGGHGVCWNMQHIDNSCHRKYLCPPPTKWILPSPLKSLEVGSGLKLAELATQSLGQSCQCYPRYESS